MACKRSDDGSSRTALFVDLIDRVRTASIRVTGSSMIPSIWPGEVIVVERCEISEVSPGHVAVFARDGRLFVHRVLSNNGIRIVAQGDTVPSPDPDIRSEHFVGRAVEVERNGRSVSLLRPRSTSAKLVAALARRSSRMNRVVQRGEQLRQRLVPS